jgi:hypothetical protein
MANQESMIQQINDLVQQSLIQGLRKAQSKLSEDTVKEFAHGMEGKLRADLVIPTDLMTSFLEHVKDPLLNVVASKFGKPIVGRGASGGLSSMGMPAGLMALAAGTGPWGVAAVTILPGLIDWVVDAIKESRQHDQMTQALRTQAYPDIIRQLRPEVEKFLRDTMMAALTGIANEYEQHLERQRAIYADSDREHSQNLAQIDEQRKRLEEMASAVRERAEADIFTS